MDHEYRKKVTIDEATVTLRTDGIVQVIFHRNVKLDLALQMLLLNIYQEITGKKPHPFLFEALNGIKVTREARDNALRIQDEAPGTAYAVVADSLAYQVIANFYVTVKRPSKPYRVFRKREEAIAWLKQYASPEEPASMTSVRNSST